MRITCPNCGAQYEVAEGAIPPGGRDVQCSACGHVWFVTRPDAAVAAGPAEPSLSGPPAEPDPAAEPEPEPAAVPVPRRPALSPEVTAILREEAERERARREAERAAQQIPVQPDLGLDEAPAARPMPPVATPPSLPGPIPEAEPAAPAPEAIPDPVSEPEPVPESAAEPATDSASEPQRGRARLPDIEEINASLRAATERAPAHLGEAEAAARARGGFRTGFLGVLTVAVLALAAYVGAPRIAQSIPAAAPALQRYVTGVDEWRLWLDLRVQELLPAENGRRDN